MDDEVPRLLPLELPHLVGREGDASVAEWPKLQEMSEFCSTPQNCHNTNCYAFKFKFHMPKFSYNPKEKITQKLNLKKAFPRACDPTSARKVEFTQPRKILFEGLCAVVASQ